MKGRYGFFLIGAIALLGLGYWWGSSRAGEQKPPTSGTIWQLKLEGDNTPNFTKYQEFAVDTEGQKLLFWADDTVKDITFTEVEYHETDGFEEKALLYKLDQLRPDTAIRLTYYLPETVPNLKLGFTLKDGSRMEFLIAQSGKDGSILLIDPKV